MEGGYIFSENDIYSPHPSNFLFFPMLRHQAVKLDFVPVILTPEISYQQNYFLLNQLCENLQNKGTNHALKLLLRNLFTMQYRHTLIFKS
jgi:hypothetical protein